MSDFPIDKWIKKPNIETYEYNPFDEAFQTRFKHWLKDGMQVQARETYYYLYDFIDRNLYQKNLLRYNENTKTYTSQGTMYRNPRYAKERYTYQRTHQFREAVSWEIKETTSIEGRRGYETRVYIDTDQIRPSVPPNKYGWGRYMGKRGYKDYVTEYDGYTIKEWIVEWIENGQQSKMFSYAGIHALEKTNEWARKNMPERIRQRMEIESDLDIDGGRTGLYVNVLKGGKPRFV